MSDSVGQKRSDSPPLEYYPVQYVQQYKDKVYEMSLELAQSRNNEQELARANEEIRQLRMEVNMLKCKLEAKEASDQWEISLLRNQATKGYMGMNPDSRLPTTSKALAIMPSPKMGLSLKPMSPTKRVNVIPESIINGSSSVVNSVAVSRAGNMSSASGSIISRPMTIQDLVEPVNGHPSRMTTSSKPIISPIPPPPLPFKTEPDKEIFMPSLPPVEEPLRPTTGVVLPQKPISAPVNPSNAKPRVAHQAPTIAIKQERPVSGTLPEPAPAPAEEIFRPTTGVTLPPSLLAAASAQSVNPPANARNITRQNSKPTPPKQPQKSLSAVVSSITNKRKASSEANNPLAKLKKRVISTAAKNNQPVGNIFKPEPKKAFSEMFSKENKQEVASKKQESAKKKKETAKKDEEPKKKTVRKGRSDEWVTEKIKELVVKYDYDFEKIPPSEFITKAKQCQYSKNLCIRRAKEIIAEKKKEDEEKEEESDLEAGAADLDRMLGVSTSETSNLGLSASDSSSSEESSSSESEDEDAKNKLTKPAENKATENGKDQGKTAVNENDIIGSIFKQVEQAPDMNITPLHKRPVKTEKTVPLESAPKLKLDEEKTISSDAGSSISTKTNDSAPSVEEKHLNDQKNSESNEDDEKMEVDSGNKLSEEEEADINQKMAEVANENDEEKKRRMSAALIDQCGLALDSDSEDESGPLEIAEADRSQDSLKIDDDSQSGSELFIDDPSAEPVPMAETNDQEKIVQMEVVEEQASPSSATKTRRSTRLSGRTSESSQEKLPVPDLIVLDNATNTSKNSNESTAWPPENYQSWSTDNKIEYITERLAQPRNKVKSPQYKIGKFVGQMKNLLKESLCLRHQIHKEETVTVIDTPDTVTFSDWIALIPHETELRRFLCNDNGEAVFRRIVQNIQQEITQITDSFPPYEVAPKEDFQKIEGLLLMFVTMVFSVFEDSSCLKEHHWHLKQLHNFALFLGDFISKTEIPEKQQAGPNSAMVFYIYCLMVSKGIPSFFSHDDIFICRLLNTIPYTAIQQYGQKHNVFIGRLHFNSKQSVDKKQERLGHLFLKSDTKEMKEASSNLTQEITKMRAAQIEEDLNETTFQMKERDFDAGKDVFRLFMSVKNYPFAKRMVYSRFIQFIVPFSRKASCPGEEIGVKDVRNFILQMHNLYAYLHTYGGCKDEAHDKMIARAKTVISIIASLEAKTKIINTIANKALRIGQWFRTAGRKEWERDMSQLNAKVANMRKLPRELLVVMNLPPNFYETRADPKGLWTKE